MPQFFISLFRLLPYLPAIIHTAEVIHGPATGADKLKTAVDLVVAAAPEVEQHITDPANRAKLEKVISVAVAAMNVAGTLKQQPQ
jgi:hypothetical protein